MWHQIDPLKPLRPHPLKNKGRIDGCNSYAALLIKSLPFIFFCLIITILFRVTQGSCAPIFYQ